MENVSHQHCLHYVNTIETLLNHNYLIGIEIGDKKCFNADDLVLISRTKDGIQHALEVLQML